MKILKQGYNQHPQELYDSNVGDVLDPFLVQENEDGEDEGVVDHPNFIFKEPTEVNETTRENLKYKPIEVLDEHTLNSRTRRLDNDQRLVLETGVNFAKSVIKSLCSCYFSSFLRSVF